MENKPKKMWEERGECNRTNKRAKSNMELIIILCVCVLVCMCKNVDHMLRLNEEEQEEEEEVEKKKHFKIEKTNKQTNKQKLNEILTVVGMT